MEISIDSDSYFNFLLILSLSPIATNHGLAKTGKVCEVELLLHLFFTYHSFYEFSAKISHQLNVEHYDIIFQ